MISNLSIYNFKSVKTLHLECDNINLLIGTNSSGKSTILQGILLLAQNQAVEAGLNGNLTSSGNFADSRCKYINEEVIKIWMKFSDKTEASIAIGVFNEGATQRLTIDRNFDGDSLHEYLGVSNLQLQYLSCNRVGPRSIYEKNTRPTEEMGTDGKYSFSYLATHRDMLLPDDMCVDKSSMTLGSQVDYWLEYIAGVTVKSEEVLGTDKVKVSYRQKKLQELRPLNVGSGISYVASMIIMCLATPEHGIVIIENPEVHLHPLAQSRLCEFFYFVGVNNRQLFIESHSDHIFNGFRAGITTHEMDKKLIKINFVSQEGDGLTKTECVEIGARGYIVNQREDMFDQFDKDMMRMVGLE